MRFRYVSVGLEIRADILVNYEKEVPVNNDFESEFI
jgi:hypothetical protein